MAGIGSRREPMPWEQVRSFAERMGIPALRFVDGQLVDEYWPSDVRWVDGRLVTRRAA